MQLLLKRTIACCMVAVASGAIATQKVAVYTSTDPTNYDPDDATLVLETVLREIDVPFAGPVRVYLPQCVQGAAQADCEAAMGVYSEVRGAAKTLGDRQLGPNGTQPVIMMKNTHPNNVGGLYDSADEAIVLYPNQPPGGVAHEMAHVYFAKGIV